MYRLPTIQFHFKGILNILVGFTLKTNGNTHFWLDAYTAAFDVYIALFEKHFTLKFCTKILVFWCPKYWIREALLQ